MSKNPKTLARFARARLDRKLYFYFSYDASKCRKCHMKYNNRGVSPVLLRFYVVMYVA